MFECLFSLTFTPDVEFLSELHCTCPEWKSILPRSLYLQFECQRIFKFTSDLDFQFLCCLKFPPVRLTLSQVCSRSLRRNNYSVAKSLQMSYFVSRSFQISSLNICFVTGSLQISSLKVYFLEGSRHIFSWNSYFIEISLQISSLNDYFDSCSHRIFSLKAQFVPISLQMSNMNVYFESTSLQISRLKVFCLKHTAVH